MTLTSLAAKHNIDPESAKAFLREWLDMQTVIGCAFGKDQHITKGYNLDSNKAMGFDSVLPLIARTTDLGE